MHNYNILIIIIKLYILSSALVNEVASLPQLGISVLLIKHLLDGLLVTGLCDYRLNQSAVTLQSIRILLIIQPSALDLIYIDSRPHGIPTAPDSGICQYVATSRA